MTSTEHVLFRSLVDGPLLVGDLPEASTFPYRYLSVPAATGMVGLNLRQKLGHLYESALAVLLEASPAFDLLARNLQIRRGAHTTVGELDFLLRDLGSGQLIHLELATKFYLAVPTGKGERKGQGLTLPGPDARDDYFRKILRLREHQLMLTRSNRDLLPKEYRDETIVVRQLIYGCLFDPIPVDRAERSIKDSAMTLMEPELEPASPEYFNAHCRRGRWLSIDECPKHFPPETEFRIIPKALWPVPLEFLEGIPMDRWSPQSPVERCVMLRVNDDTVPYFVAPSGYPEQRAS